MELLGREFSIVKDGLDPNEVVDFLETIAGSSAAAFKRLEQFSAFQTVAKTMGESIAEARQLAEHAKIQARVEAQREKAQAREEVKQQVASMLDRAKKSCTASIEDTCSVLLEAITKAQEIEETAFEKAKEMVAINLAEIHQTVQDAVESPHRQVDSGQEQSADKSSGPLAESADITSADEVQQTEPEEQPSIDLTNLQESLTSLQESLTSLHESKSALEHTQVVQPSDSETEEDQGPTDVETTDSEPEDGSDHLYSGDVTVTIPEGAEESWMREFRRRILKTPGMRIRGESGVDEKTTTVSLSLDEPAPLLLTLQELPNVSRVIEGQNGGEPSEKPRLRLWPRVSRNSRQTTITIELDNNAPDQSSQTSDDRVVSAA